jgi:hypothetical protein
MHYVSTMKAEEKLELLDTRIKLNLSLNDLRLIVNCFRAIEYQMKLDDEPYLDEEGLYLAERLKATYGLALKKLGL